MPVIIPDAAFPARVQIIRIREQKPNANISWTASAPARAERLPRVKLENRSLPARAQLKTAAARTRMHSSSIPGSFATVSIPREEICPLLCIR